MDENDNLIKNQVLPTTIKKAKSNKFTLCHKIGIGIYVFIMSLAFIYMVNRFHKMSRSLEDITDILRNTSHT